MPRDYKGVETGAGSGPSDGVICLCGQRFAARTGLEAHVTTQALLGGRVSHGPLVGGDGRDAFIAVPRHIAEALSAELREHWHRGCGIGPDSARAWSVLDRLLGYESETTP